MPRTPIVPRRTSTSDADAGFAVSNAAEPRLQDIQPDPALVCVGDLQVSGANTLQQDTSEQEAGIDKTDLRHTWAMVIPTYWGEAVGTPFPGDESIAAN